MSQENCTFNPALVAAEAAGGRKELAQKLTPPCTRQAIERWIKSAEIPLRRVPQVSEITGIPKSVLSPLFKEK